MEVLKEKFPNFQTRWPIFIRTRHFSSFSNTFKSATLSLNNYVIRSNMVIVTCKLCKMLSFTLCVVVLFHVTKRKIGSKRCDHTIATFPFRAILQFLTPWFMVIKIYLIILTFIHMKLHFKRERITYREGKASPYW